MQEKYLCLSDSHLRSFREFSAKTVRSGGLKPHTSSPRPNLGAKSSWPKNSPGGSNKKVKKNTNSMYATDANLSKEERTPSHVDETPDFRNEQETVNTFVEGGLLGFTAPTLKGLVVQNPAQAKIYTKLHINFPLIENFQDVETAKYLAAYLEDLFNHCLPPSTDPTPPLMWWDSIRYFLHGQTSMVIKKLIYSQSQQVSQGLNAPLTLEVSLRKIFLFMDRQSFEMNGSDLIITVESKDTQKNMLSARRVTSRRANRANSGSFSGSKAAAPPPKQILRWKLCNIPCISLSIANTPAMYHADDTPNNVFSHGVYDHHDVYCRPAFEDSPLNKQTLSNYDKFAYFRMKRKSSKWGMLINFTDSPDNVILLFFRLDIIERLTAAFASPAVDVTDDSFQHLVSLQEDAQAFLYGDNYTHEQQLQHQQNQPGEYYEISKLSHSEKVEQKRLYLLARKQYADSLVKDITMCITDLDLHLKLDKFLACSWPSSLILDGAVFSQDSLRVDVQFVNQDVEEGGELEVVETATRDKAGKGRVEELRGEGEGEGEGSVAATSITGSADHPVTSLQLKHIDGSIERIEVYLRGACEIFIFIFHTLLTVR